MTQDKRWQIKYDEKKDESRELKEERLALFERLLEMGEKYKRVNQYQ